MKMIRTLSLTLMLVSGSVLSASRLARLAQIVCMPIARIPTSAAVGLAKCMSTLRLDRIKFYDPKIPKDESSKIEALKGAIDDFKVSPSKESFIKALEITHDIFLGSAISAPLGRKTYLSTVELWRHANAFLTSKESEPNIKELQKLIHQVFNNRRNNLNLVPRNESFFNDIYSEVSYLSKNEETESLARIESLNKSLRA